MPKAGALPSIWSCVWIADSCNRSRSSRSIHQAPNRKQPPLTRAAMSVAGSSRGSMRRSSHARASSPSPLPPQKNSATLPACTHAHHTPLLPPPALSMLREPVADPLPAAREHATARAPVRPTTPTILFENMTKGGRESYASISGICTLRLHCTALHNTRQLQ